MYIQKEIFKIRFFIWAIALLFLKVIFYGVSTYILIENGMHKNLAKFIVNAEIIILLVLYFNHFKSVLSAARLNVFYFLPFLFAYILLCLGSIYAHAIPAYSELSLSPRYVSALTGGQTVDVLFLQATTLWSLLLSSVFISSVFVFWVQRNTQQAEG